MAPHGSAAPSPGGASSMVALEPEFVRRVQRRLATERLVPNAEDLARVVRAESAGVLDEVEVLGLIRRLEQELAGCGPLEGILADPATTDVVVNGPDDVRVDRGRGWEPAGITFPDEAAVQRLARRLAVTAGRRLDDAHPFVDGLLPGGVRLHALLPPLVPDGACLSLRVLRPARHSLAALRDLGALPGHSHAVVQAVLGARLAVAVSGATGSGKTTLLAALLGEVGTDERIVTVEDVEELRPAHPHVVRLVARPANVEGAGAIGLRELVRQALRMRPDRLVLGEVRGAEVVDVIAALNTGHDGGAVTVHAHAAADVPARLAALASYGGMSQDAVGQQLAGAIQVVMHLRRAGNQRMVAEIAVVARDGPAGVRVVPAFVAGERREPGAALLADLVRERGLDPPW